MRHGTCTGSVRGLLAGLVLWLGAVPSAWAGDLESLRERLDDTLKPHAGRLAEIEAREHGDPPDRQQRAEKITRDRIAQSTASLNRGGPVRTPVDAAEMGPGEASALADASRKQGEQLDAVDRAWGAAGSERRKLREALAAVQKDLERANADLAQATAVADAAVAQVAESGVIGAVARIEAEAAEAGDRLRARWQREWDARERERLHREHAAGERERGVR
jgi:hypothetical protein